MSGSTEAPYSTLRMGKCSISCPPTPEPIAPATIHCEAMNARPVARSRGGSVVPRNERPSGPAATIIPEASK